MVLDDAHRLLASQKVEDTSVLKLMRRAAWTLEATFVFCGTQVSIETFSDGPQHVRIADPSFITYTSLSWALTISWSPMRWLRFCRVS
jgi:hypothetical protein